MSYLRILGTALVLACSAQLTQSAPAASQPVVVPVMRKDLPDEPGKEMLMLTVDYPPGAKRIIRDNGVFTLAHCLKL